MSATAKQTNVFLGLGRRKTATARVRLFPGGTGKITVNGKDVEEYCYHDGLTRAAKGPLNTLEVADQFDAIVLVSGSGPNSQAGAIALGIARALEKYNPEYRIPLKRAGHLKRDPRKRERKKSGQPGARKRFQFSKR